MDATTTTAGQLTQAIDQLEAMGATVRRPSNPYPWAWAVTWPGDRLQYGFRTRADLIRYAEGLQAPA